jgi:alpha-L-fucosidase
MQVAAIARAGPSASPLTLRVLPLPHPVHPPLQVGIFINMGVYSVPSFGTPNGGASGEWFWERLVTEKSKPYVDFVADTEAPGFTYPDYAPRFTAKFMNATQWAALFKAAGAKYVVQTT